MGLSYYRRLAVNISFQAKWLKMLLNSGKTSEDGTEIISKSTFESMINATSVMSGGSLLTCYAKGWGRLGYQGHDVSFCLITTPDSLFNFSRSLLLTAVDAQEYQVSLGSSLAMESVLSSLRMSVIEITSVAL